MSNELDLEVGDPDAVEEITSRERRRRERAARSGANASSSKSSSTPKTTTSDRDLQSRLETAIGKIADQLEARHDEELATVLREETKPMATGSVSLTKRVPVLRTPLVLFVELLEPTLAFFRVGRLLTVRWFERRAAAANEEQSRPEGFDYPAVYPDAVVVNP